MFTVSECDGNYPGCCGIILLYGVKTCHLNWFNKTLIFHAEIIGGAIKIGMLGWRRAKAGESNIQ